MRYVKLVVPAVHYNEMSIAKFHISVCFSFFPSCIFRPQGSYQHKIYKKCKKMKNSIVLQVTYAAGLL